MSVDVESIVAVQDSTIDEMVTKIERIHGPVWDARNEFLKLLISLSSAIFAGTITFSGDALEDASCRQGWLAIASWGLLLVSIIAGLYGLFHATTLRSFHVRYFNQRPNLESKLSEVDPTQGLWEQIAPIFRSAVDDAVNPLGDADRRVESATKACIGFFVGGLLLFLIFAAWRFG